MKEREREKRLFEALAEFHTLPINVFQPNIEDNHMVVRVSAPTKEWAEKIEEEIRAKGLQTSRTGTEIDVIWE